MMLYFAAAFYFGIIQHLQELFIKNILITFLLSAIILISFVAIYFRINNKIYKFVIIVLLAYLLYIIDIVHLFLKYPYNTFSKYALITIKSFLLSLIYFKGNKKSISASIDTESYDYLLHIEDLQGVGASKDISLAAFVALCSSSLKKPLQESMVILGSMTIGGTISKVEELANTLQVCFDSGAKKILLPMSSAVDISSVPSDLFAKFNISFYNSPEDAVYKALGIE